jgi:Domain of unknown function (DUF929)
LDPEADGGVSDPGSGASTPDPVAIDGGPTDDSEPEHHDPSRRTARFAWGAVVVLLVGVIALVIYALAGSPSTPQTVQRTMTSDDVVTALTRVPPSVFDSVGVNSPEAQLVPPTVLTGQPSLVSKGKPEVLFVGAEFCPFCGSERWALIVALSRFGHFATLRNMQSAETSVFAGIQTFSFVGTTYASPYITLTCVELFSDAVNANGAFTRIARLSPAQSAVVNRYGATGTTTGSLPFVDIDNQMVASTSGYSPAVIVRQSQAAIAGELSQTHARTGQAIVASANYLTAGICAATSQQPGAVCASKGVREAGQALGLG